MSLILALLLGCPIVTDADVDAALDRDGDGFVGAIHGGDDCNDDDARIYPGAPDPWYDGVLLDCNRTNDFDADGDGLVLDDDCDDDDPDVAGPSEWFVDADFDNSGAGMAVLDCDPGPGWAPTNDDCDDANSNLHPLASERCNGIDDDCDGFVDDEDPTVDPNDFIISYEDRDGDGVGDGNPSRTCLPPEGWAAIDGDCDDDDPNNTPGGYERCDGVDNDCDGLVDDDDVNLDPDEATWYIDDDSDGYGDDATADPLLRCLPNEGEVNVGGDCNDDDPTISPGVEERCDGIDNDCDGVFDASDPDVVLPVWYLDVDEDGIGDSDFPTASCVAPDGYVPRGEDCDDDDPDAGAPVLVLADVDGDGFGGDTLAETCDPAAGDVLVPGDCNDDDATVNPAAQDEPYDGIDQDCSGTSDYDADQDGQDALAYGGKDCNDADPITYDGAPEVWYDGIDQDCRGGSDYDADDDGYDAFGGAGADCDDNDPLTYPDAPEIWGDGIDQDCGRFDDLDVDMNGLPDMDGCTTVARVHVPGDESTLADAIANASDCTEILLGSGPHDAQELDVSGRRLLVRADVDDAILVGVPGAVMFVQTSGFLGVANMEVAGGAGLVDAGVSVLASDLQVHDVESTLIDVDDVNAAVWVRFLDITGGAGVVDVVDGVADVHAVHIHDLTSDPFYVFRSVDADVTLSDVSIHDSTIGTLISSVRGHLDVTSVEANTVYAGSILTLSDSVGQIDGLSAVGGTFVSNQVYGRSDSPFHLSNLRFVGLSQRLLGPFAYDLLYGSHVVLDGVELVGNTVPAGTSSLMFLEGASSIRNGVLAGNVVDNAITCWTATDVSHVTVAGNTGYGLVYDCRADHVVVVDNRVGAYSLLSLAYSDVFGNNTDIQRMPNPVGINGNVSIDPGFQSFDPGLPPAYMDVHLRPDSPLRDAGDPARFDVDGTVADLGAYGGPGGENDLFDGELDGLPDSWELRVGLDPAIDDALEDPDGDGLDNLGEFLKGTRPDVPDTDADEILDLFDDFPLDADDA